MKENKVVTISAQIPAELEKTLIELCELEERSKSYFIKKALEKLILEKTKGANFSKKETNPSAKKNNK
jgi:predicted DNA-binding protein